MMVNKARLIDANALIDVLIEHHDLFVNAWGGFEKLPCEQKARVDEIDNCMGEVANAPTVDAVEVTRCKGCREYAPGFIRPYLGWCNVWDTTVRETGFCHHGKPRSEEKPKPAWPPQEEMEDPCED